MFNPIECYCTEKFQYILIHKNGCSMIIDTMMNNHSVNVNEFVYNDRPAFAVIRDPWDRTISGLSYDLERSFGDVTESILDHIDFKRLFYQPINKSQRITGYISHTSVQTGYLFDVTPTFYVDLKDLTNFLSIHFENVSFHRRNQSCKKIKNKLLEILDSRSDIKDDFQKYLSIDYYFIDRIKNTEVLWDFSMGKMW